MVAKTKKRRGLGAIEYAWDKSKDPWKRKCVIIPGRPTNMADVRNCASACSSHWFDKGSMSFFGSRVGSGMDPAYGDGKGGAYFVSSEKRPRSDDPRAYSVRHYANCSISTVGEFQGYKTKAAATKAAQALAKTGLAGLGRARRGGLRGTKPSGERDYMVTTRQGEGRRNLTKAEAIALARVRTVEWAEVGQDADAKVVYQVTGGLIPWEKGQLKGLGRARRAPKKRSR